MFTHTSRLQFEAKPARPDAHYARKLQELIGGAFGEMAVTMQYLFQGWNCRMEGKYRDLIMDVSSGWRTGRSVSTRTPGAVWFRRP